MPVIQHLFYFAGFTAFVLSALIMLVVLMIAIRLYKRVNLLADKAEEKIDTPFLSALLPLLPAILAVVGLFKGRRK